MTRSRSFCFTYFIFDNNTFDQLNDLECTWMIYQNEVCPDTGRLHIQGAIWFPNALTKKGCIERMPRDPYGEKTVSVRIAVGSAAQNKIYCTKLETRAPQNMYRAHEHGTMPRQGQRNDLEAIMQLIKKNPRIPELQLWEEFPYFMNQYGNRINHYRNLLIEKQRQHPVVRTYYGKTGTGKSYAAKQEAMSTGLPVYYMPDLHENARMNIDGYRGEKNVIIEDYAGEIPYRTFLRMLDTYELTLNTKGSFASWCPSNIWITSNVHPMNWYPTKEYNDGPLERRLENYGSMTMVFLNKYH